MCLCKLLALPAILLALAGCASDRFDPADFATSLPPPTPGGPVAAAAPLEDYRIGPLDKVSVNVLQLRDMNVEKAQVDATGRLALPLVGYIQAQGSTVAELGDAIALKLRDCCLQNPQVLVRVDDAVSQQITVTGAVMESNVYVLRGRTSLLQAITMAKGPDRNTANLKRVAVYRMSNGQRVGALFNVEDIRAGKSPDPEIFGGDTIIVDSSNTRAAWRDIIMSVPFFGVFTAF